MNIPNGKIDQKNKNIKMTNIIYYDENIDKYIKSIHNDSDLFERKTPGYFMYKYFIIRFCNERNKKKYEI